MEKSFAILGGDMRQVHLAQLLIEDGHSVVTCGLEKGGAPCPVSSDKALRSDILVLPLPVCRNGALHTPLCDASLSMETVFGSTDESKILLGGMIRSIPEPFREERKYEIIDYFEREELQILNAVSTAEGAIMYAMRETVSVLQGRTCLVVGFGRIGKLLAHRLRALGAKVSVAARKTSDLAWIEAYGYHPLDISQMKDKLYPFEVIFNTVPVVLFDKNVLDEVRRDALLMELASLPGGFDCNAVKELGLRYIAKRGLPGEVAPKSAACVIKDMMYCILKERGVVF